MTDESDIQQSRKFEMQKYLDSLTGLYKTSLLQNSEIYDIASAHTNQFFDISAESILRDSRIIKVLRYAIAPSISQMKFGQFFGMNSIDKFERDRVTIGTKKYCDLQHIASEMASFIGKNLDRKRFAWLDSPDMDCIDLAHSYAKNWTCSIAADQNAQTKYRNWRKDQQEHAIASQLVAMGYTKSSYKGVINAYTDINIGEYTQELRVRGRTLQKADLIARSKRKTKRLVLIEAKAVGVELDSTKRIKECCDKSSDWRSSAALNEPKVAVVIAGFFNPKGIQNLRASEIEVVWEHRLSDLERLL